MELEPDVPEAEDEILLRSVEEVEVEDEEVGEGFAGAFEGVDGAGQGEGVGEDCVQVHDAEFVKWWGGGGCCVGGCEGGVCDGSDG